MVYKEMKKYKLKEIIIMALFVILSLMLIILLKRNFLMNNKQSTPSLKEYQDFKDNNNYEEYKSVKIILPPAVKGSAICKIELIKNDNTKKIMYFERNSLSEVQNYFISRANDFEDINIIEENLPIFKQYWEAILGVSNIIGLLLHIIFTIYIVKQGNLTSGKLDYNSKISSKNKSYLTFKDVAGNEEEKEEMKELIDFLKQPKKYFDVGATIPKGVLLEGPPGTGKTLLAKALAGEANVSFYAVSGSEFDGILVGLGSKKIKTLFRDIQDNAPCILFIDEIDSLGKKRGGHDNKHEQTLNQLLTEMDGFHKDKGIIVIGATNRVDILDSALLRPGRFDRIFKVGLPDVKSREEILRVHSRNKKIAPEVDFKQLAKQTSGMSGAQLASVLNEASILTVRNNKNNITREELEEAVDRVLMGPAKKSIKYNEEEKKMVAYHEAGHAVIGLKLKHAQKVQKITIIPRGSAGGYNLMMPEKEIFFSSKKRMLANIISYLGGRVAEELMFDDISSGAYGDFKQATKIAQLMVTKYGMSDLGPIQDSEFSDKKEIDHEIKKIINTCHQETKTIMKANKSLLDKIANLLLEQETITSKEIEKLI